MHWSGSRENCECKKKTVETGKNQINSFQSSSPEGFWSKIKNEVVTMKTPTETKKKCCRGI